MSKRYVKSPNNVFCDKGSEGIDVQLPPCICGICGKRTNKIMVQYAKKCMLTYESKTNDDKTNKTRQTDKTNNSKAILPSKKFQAQGTTDEAERLNYSPQSEKPSRRDPRKTERLSGCDSGYGIRTWLLTPLLNPQSPAEECYNAAHISTRSVIESTFGLLKSRFRCLDRSGGVLQYKPENVADIVMSCCILHNIALSNNITGDIREGLDDEPPVHAAGDHEQTASGVETRLAPEGHVSPETEQVSSPGSASSTHLEEHDEEDFDDDDDDDDDDAAAAAIDTQIQASDHEEVPIETVLPPKRPANTTYDAIVASEGKIVEAENRRHSDLMTVLERMIALQEETVSQLAHLHRVFIEVPKQLQKINTSFEALVVQQTQANYWRMTNVPRFNTSQAGSVHAGQFSPHSSDIHSPGPNVTGQVADIAVQFPDDILPLPSVQIQQQTPTKEATKTKQDTHETDQPSLVQCLPTCSHVSVGTSPVREQSLPKSPVGESLPKSPVGESLPKSPVGESLPKSPVGESLPKSPVGESLPKSPVGESLATSPVGEQSLPKSPVGESLPTSPAREVPEATQSGSAVPKVGGKRKRKIQETTSRPVTRSQKEQKK
ncbi:uncharacterized protein LOC142495486 [Ascaphus truei]|uniref:uncharacterized protein LOC142495486 n=1 Tax=Ascaphus truei TaxID=8439 RepID=UPI003F597251